MAESKFAAAMKGTMPTAPGTGTPPAVTPPVTPPAVTPPVVTPPVTPPATPPAVTPPVTPPPGTHVAVPIALAPPDPEEILKSDDETPKKSKEWKALKSLTLEFRTRAENAEKLRLAQVQSLEEKLKTAAPADYEQIKAELAKKNILVDAFTLDVQPTFIAKFQGRRDAVVNNLKQSIGNKTDAILEVLRLPESESKRKNLSELMDGMDDIQKSDIGSANRDLRQIESDRVKELTEARSQLDEIGKQRTEQASKQKQEMDGIFTGRITELQDPAKGIAAFQKRDKDDAWNAEVEQRVKTAQAIFEGRFESPKERAEAAIRAACAEVYLREATAWAGKVTELEKTVQRLQGAGPRITGDGGGGAEKPQRGGFLKKVSTGMVGQKKT